jgi:2-oxoglutarate dehydrogenase E1 component
MNNMETFWSTSHAAGAQSSYLESLYELYLKDPSTVPDDWKIYFDSLPSVSDEQHEVSHQEIVERLKEEEINPPINAQSSDNISNSKQVKVIQLIQAYRNRGHYKAMLDPLGLKPTRHCDDLELSFHDLNSSDLSEVFNTDTLKIEKKSASLSEIIQALEAIYCGTLGLSTTTFHHYLKENGFKRG